MTSGIDIVMVVYDMLNEPVLLNAISPGQLWQHNIPQNSPYTEVAIKFPTTDAYESELRFFDIEIRTPNLGTLPSQAPMRPYADLPPDTTFPDLAKFKEVVDVILPLIRTQDAFYVETKIPGVPIRDTDGNWRVNIRVEFTLLDTQDTHEATLVGLSWAPDGYGGGGAEAQPYWEGTARRVSIVDSPQLVKTAGSYGLHMRSTWLVPKEGIPAPRKSSELRTAEGVYVVTGIAPEGEFWRLTTTREDGPF